MPGMDGLTLLDKVRYVAPGISVMVITGFGDVQMCTKALKLGAVDFIEKPLDRDFLRKVQAILKLEMSPKPFTTSLKEIARETNLSITTVSRALRKQGEISSKTRDRVLAAAKQMRYRPNLLVHGIRTGKTGTMGVIVPPYDSYWTQVLYGINEELTAANHVYINTWCKPVESEDSYGLLLIEQLNRLLDRRVDGIILWAHLASFYNERIVEDLEARDVPVVTIDHELPFADAVETDEKLGAFEAARHLLELGHRHLAHLAWDDSYKWAQLRRLFFEQQVNSTPGATCVSLMANDDREVDQLTRKLLETKPRPTAIFACSDRVAELIYQIVNKIGLRIPEDLSIVGFADLEVAKWMQPGLTTIRQDGFATGKAAARLLVNRSLGKIEEAKPQRLRIECKLIKRGSTAPLN
jgi:LacI family transcriptional regulator